MSSKLALLRVVRATTAPLALEQVAKVAPAVFSKTPGATTLAPYNYISTEAVLNTMLKNGYGVSEASQQRSPREQGADIEGKHMLRFRTLEYFNAPRSLASVVPEIVVVNAHNASSKLHMFVGLWRYICLNGLMTGNTVGSISIKHQKGIADETRRALERIFNSLLPVTMGQVKAMEKKQLTATQQVQFAQAAIAMRWPTNPSAVREGDLLEARREADRGNDMWHVYNRVQENVMMGGFESHRPTRNRTLTRLERVTEVVSINRSLWDSAVALTV